MRDNDNFKFEDFKPQDSGLDIMLHMNKVDLQENIYMSSQSREFSNNTNYIMEQMPSNIGVFGRKKWIKEKIALLGSKKALMFVEKSKVMWAFLDNEEKYWMPVEKSQFYMHIFQDNGSSTLIIEVSEKGTNYYGLVDKFLVVFTKSYQEAVDNIKKYNNGRKIITLGIDTDENCDKSMKSCEIARKIFSKKCNENEKFTSEINDDLIYLNEEHEQQASSGVVINKKDSMEYAFFYWFRNIKNKIGYKRKYLLGFLLAGIVLFSIADIYSIYNGVQIRKELEITMQKINKATQEERISGI